MTPVRATTPSAQSILYHHVACGFFRVAAGGQESVSHHSPSSGPCHEHDLRAPQCAVAMPRQIYAMTEVVAVS